MPDGDWSKRLAAGDTWNPSAQWVNNVTHAARKALSDRRHGGGASSNSPKAEGLVWVRNDSGSDRQEFDVLGIAGVVFAPTDNLSEFQARPTLTGVTPSSASHRGKFVITLEPIAAGAIGRAFLAGWCVAYVNVQSAGDRFADVTDGNADHLTSGAAGGARILWSAGGTGNQWAIVLLAAADDGLLPVNLSQSGGSDGTDSDGAATYTYNATNAITGASIPGGPFAVTWARAGGHVNKATHGTGYFDPSGNFVLWQADETPVDDSCT